MGLFGSIAGGALKIGGSIWGGIEQSKSASRIKSALQNQLRENQDWYDRRYNEDATQRADAQSMLTRVEDNIRQRNAQAAGTAAVMGGTEESTAAAKEADNKALTDATAQIAAQNETRKDNIEQQFLNNKKELNNALVNNERQRGDNIAKATAGVGDAAGGIASLF